MCDNLWAELSLTLCRLTRLNYDTLLLGYKFYDYILFHILLLSGRLLKAFQIEFNWYQLASWVNLTEQWPFRTSWIIYHHEAYEEHIDDTTSLKHIFEK